MRNQLGDTISAKSDRICWHKVDIQPGSSVPCEQSANILTASVWRKCPVIDKFFSSRSKIHRMRERRLARLQKSTSTATIFLALNSSSYCSTIWNLYIHYSICFIYVIVLCRQSLGQGYIVPPNQMPAEFQRMWMDWSTAICRGIYFQPYYS